MYAIAGIVCLNRNKYASEKDLLSMMKAMSCCMDYEVESFATSDNSVIVRKMIRKSDAKSSLKYVEKPETARVFCIGELYNEEAQKAESVERFLLDRYQRYGVDDFACGLNGAFAAVIADPRDGSVTLLTDHTDSRPLYTMIHNNKLYFASEVKAIARLDELPCEPDVSGVLSLAARSFFVNHRTLMKNVQQMDYATICHIRGGKVRSWPYWRYIIEPSSDKGYKYYLEEFAGLLRQAVRRRVSSGRVAIMLSGGVDSRGILSCLDKPWEIPIVTYTGRTRETRHRLGDWAVAERIAKQVGMNLSVIHYDGRQFARAMQESVHASDGAAGFVFENIWEDVRQATGAEYLLMGDQCITGYTGPLSNAQVLSSINVYSLQSLNELQGCMRQDRLDSFIELSARDIQAINASCKTEEPHDRVDQLNFEQVLIYFLPPKRRLTARHGMFVRNPWYDLDICNFVQKIPRRYRVGKSLFRKTISYIEPSLSRLPRAREGETIDYRSYLREYERKEKLVSQMIFSDNPFFGEFFDVQAVEKLVKDVCLSDNATEKRRRFDPKTLLPMAIRGKVSTTVRYFTRPSIQLSGVQLLLRILTVATALRHLSNRFKSKL